MPNTGIAKLCSLAGAILLLAGILTFGCAQVDVAQSTESSDVGPEQDSVATQETEQPRSRSPEEWQRRREEMYQQLNLTDEQREQLQALDQQYAPGSGREAREARRQAMSEILTEEQMEQMRAMFRQRGPRN